MSTVWVFCARKDAWDCDLIPFLPPRDGAPFGKQALAGYYRSLELHERGWKALARAQGGDAERSRSRIVTETMGT